MQNIYQEIHFKILLRRKYPLLLLNVISIYKLILTQFDEPVFINKTKCYFFAENLAVNAILLEIHAQVTILGKESIIKGREIGVSFSTFIVSNVTY